MFETPYYIPIHTIKAFRKRIDNTLSTYKIRELIQSNLINAVPDRYQVWNNECCPIYKLQYNNKKYYIPVIKDKIKQDKNLWNVIPTIFLEGMRFKEKRLKYDESNTASALARELNIDRSTITNWIEKGMIKCLKHEKGTYYRICESEFYKMKIFKKAYDKWSKAYTDNEIYIILNNKNKSNKYIAKLINRNENSVNIKRCRMRKEGYDV